MNEQAQTQDNEGQFIDPRYGDSFGVEVRFFDEPGKATVEVAFTTAPKGDGQQLPPRFPCIQQTISVNGQPQLTLLGPDGPIYALHEHAEDADRWTDDQINAAMDKAWSCTNGRLNPTLNEVLTSIAPGVFMVLLQTMDPKLTSKDRNALFTTIGLSLTDLPEGAAVYGQNDDGTADKIAEVVADHGDAAEQTLH